MAEYGAFYRDAGHVTVEKIVNFSLGQGSGRTHITEGVWEALGALKGFRRSSHAERQALLSLLALESNAADVNRDGSLDFSGFSGTVRLYVTHTLCISCLAACHQYKALHPRLHMSVTYSVL
ncbi:unnamed protein product [Symbiodinium microadriaticum]|nr:unnamed protein product [Symbiodinium microadriaticum]